MPECQERLQRELAARGRMRTAHDADHAIGEERLGADRAPMLEARADGDVDLVRLQRVDGACRRQMQDIETEPRRPRPHPRQQPRQEQEPQQVRHPHREAPVGGAGIVAGVGGEEMLDLAQQLARGARQLPRPGRRLHPRRGAHEDLVLEEMPQTAERIAHGGLAQSDTLGSPRHMALRQQRIESDEKVEIHRSQIQNAAPRIIHGINTLRTIIYLTDNARCVIVTARHEEMPGAPPMTAAAELKSTVKVCMFDQYGTVVDMQGGLAEVATPFLEAKGWQGNPNSFVTWWRRTHFENSMIDALLHREHTPYREIGQRSVAYVMDRAGISYRWTRCGRWWRISCGCGRFPRCPRRWTGCTRATGWWCCRTAIPICWRRPSSITASRSSA